jgi:hypothetical protein
VCPEACLKDISLKHSLQLWLTKKQIDINRQKVEILDVKDLFKWEISEDIEPCDSCHGALEHTPAWEDT